MKRLLEHIIYALRSDDLYNPLFEMAKIGYLNSQYEVCVWCKEGGNIPHFHVFDSETEGKNFNAAIRIDTNHYFKHGKAKNDLTREMRNQLVEFLKKTNKKGISNWDYLVETWNRNNSKVMIPEDAEMPDYTTIGPNL